MGRRAAPCALAFLALACGIDRTGIGPRDGVRDATPRPPDAAADASPAADSAPSPDAGCAATEVCAEDSRDEDCDGIIDEGCPYHFGRPSPLIRLHRSADYHWSPWLSPDGLRLWFRAGLGPAGGVLHRAVRPTPDDPFETPVAVLDPGVAGHDISAFTLSADETELIAEAMPHGALGTTRLWRATRPTRDDPFGPFAELPGFAGAVGRELNPSLRPDGLELLFVTDRDGTPAMWHAFRDTAGSPFRTPEPLGVPNEGWHDYTPWLMPDGLTLFFARSVPEGGLRIHRTERAAPDSGSFSVPVPVAELGAAPGDITYFAMISAGTREIFFASDRDWSPTETAAIWRARVCRSGPCVEAEVPCPSGLRSPDLRHCYGSTTDVFTWEAGRGVCLASGGDLASIHSPAELAFVLGLLGPVGGAWVGGTDAASECNVGLPGCSFAWSTGEPFLFEDWSTGEPNDAGATEDCLLLWIFGDGRFADVNCDGRYPMVCESELARW